MGIIGLSVFNHNRRTKEIGVRKALGAQNGFIMTLLLSDFIRLVMLSNLIGIVASLLLSLGTVSLLAIKTIRANPVDSLRYE